MFWDIAVLPSVLSKIFRRIYVCTLIGRLLITNFGHARRTLWCSAGIACIVHNVWLRINKHVFIFHNPTFFTLHDFLIGLSYSWQKSTARIHRTCVRVISSVAKKLFRGVLTIIYVCLCVCFYVGLYICKCKISKILGGRVWPPPPLRLRLCAWYASKLQDVGRLPMYVTVTSKPLIQMKSSMCGPEPWTLVY